MAESGPPPAYTEAAPSVENVPLAAPPVMNVPQAAPFSLGYYPHGPQPILMVYW